jgi:RHS repeat-associated protein
MVKMTDAETHPTTYEYDPLSRLVAVIDALNDRTEYTFDPVGNLLTHKDANQHITQFEVDLLGCVIRETDPIQSLWEYDYDEVGNLSYRKDANGAETAFTFDPDNLLLEINYPTGPNVRYTYDENHNLTAIEDTSGKEEFTLDELNRLTRAERTAGLLQGEEVQYEYDPASNRTKIIYPNGDEVAYVHDATNWLESVRDPKNVKLTRYTRDPVGLPTRIDSPNDTYALYSWDAADRLTKLFNGKPQASTNIISNFEYLLDKVGNRKKTTEQVTRGQLITWKKIYTYDAIYRLTNSVETPNRKPYQKLTSNFTYDPVGNMLRRVSNIHDNPDTPSLPGPEAVDFTYEDANHMLTSVPRVYKYDLNGARTEMENLNVEVGDQDKPRGITYAYDYENRLIEAETFRLKNNGDRQFDARLNFTFDGLGRRRERQIKDQGQPKFERYLFDGLTFDPLAEYVEPAHPITTHYYRDPVQVLSRNEIQPQAQQANRSQYFHHYDGLGSVSGWTNHKGQEVHWYRYAPFGRLIDNNGPANSSNQTEPHNPLTFSGKFWDTELELNHFGARDYDSWASVWIQPDPFRGRIEKPTTLHRTMYVEGNPTTTIEIYGYGWAEALVGTIAGGIVAGAAGTVVGGIVGATQNWFSPAKQNSKTSSPIHQVPMQTHRDC